MCVRAAACCHHGDGVRNREVHHQISESVSEQDARLSAGHVSGCRMTTVYVCKTQVQLCKNSGVCVCVRAQVQAVHTAHLQAEAADRHRSAVALLSRTRREELRGHGWVIMAVTVAASHDLGQFTSKSEMQVSSCGMTRK